MTVTAPWTVEIGPGAITAEGAPITLEKAVSLNVAPVERIQIRGEHHPKLPLFNPKTSGWRKGARMNKLITQECSATGKLYPESFRIRRVTEPTTPLERGKDYDLDDFWATFGRLEGGAIAEGEAVLVDYDYSPDRLDSIIRAADGQVSLLLGQAGIGVVLPPHDSGRRRRACPYLGAGSVPPVDGNALLSHSFHPRSPRSRRAFPS